MDTLAQMTPLTMVLSNLSTYLPALGVRGAALLGVVLLTRHVRHHPARKLALVGLTLMLADKVLAALHAGIMTWIFAHQHPLMHDMTVLMLSNLLGGLAPKLLESAGLLMLAWAMVQALQQPGSKDRAQEP